MSTKENKFIIPLNTPVYRRISLNLQGLSWWRQILATAQNPPMMEILEDWIIDFPDGLKIIIPKGFKTDGASIPKPLWSFISPFGPLLEGAIIHDFGYQYGCLLSPFSENQVFNLKSYEMRNKYPKDFERYIPVYIGKDRSFFDRLLKCITIDHNGATVQANLAYPAVRIFGIFTWNKYRKYGAGTRNNNSLGIHGV